jgi:hypothetical protein
MHEFVTCAIDKDRGSRLTVTRFGGPKVFADCAHSWHLRLGADRGRVASEAVADEGFGLSGCHCCHLLPTCYHVNNYFAFARK